MKGREATYGVDVEHVDVRRRHERVLEEARNHMPRLELSHPHASAQRNRPTGGTGTHEEQRGDDIQPDGGEERDDDVAEDGIREERVGRQRSVSLDDVINALECQEERSDLNVSETRAASQNSCGSDEETKSLPSCTP